MKRIGLIIGLFFLGGCVSFSKYSSLQKENEAIILTKKAIKKEIAIVEKTNKILEDSIAQLKQLATLLSTQIEKRLIAKNIRVKLDPEDLKGLRIFNQEMDDAYFLSLKQNHNYSDTNSAKNTGWMSPQEKQLLYWLNYARLNPQKFCMKYVYPSYSANSTNVYYATLMDYMLHMKPVPALIPDKKFFESAKCHAESMGKAGLTGHKRLEGCKSAFSGECCSYGLANPLDILLQLLIDEGVTSLGHRYICLGTYTRAGIAIRPHKSYGTNAVLDLAYRSI